MTGSKLAETLLYVWNDIGHYQLERERGGGGELKTVDGVIRCSGYSPHCPHCLQEKTKESHLMLLPTLEI